MSTPRCIYFVKQQLEKHGIKYHEIRLGEVLLKEQITADQQSKLEHSLNEFDLFIINEKNPMLVEKIKQVIAAMFSNNDDESMNQNYSWYISKKLGYNYTYLANLFSEMEGITIEHFIIANKIEKVKQLLLHENLSLTQIADKLQYSSVAHLSSQFKKVTGTTASQFKEINHKQQQL
jgi:AraC-like DNA-binding protein